jgi:hypothetical protein
MEKKLNQFIKIGFSISFVMIIVLSLFKFQSVFLVKLNFLFFAFSLFSLGLWTILGTIYTWESFKKGHKKVDFEKQFGKIGSFIYISLGLLVCSISVLTIIIIYILS